MTVDNFKPARKDRLPEDFGRWFEADPGGWTVAHEAARHLPEPAGSVSREEVDRSGWTVAHEAARRREGGDR